ncbi:MAG: hypothetical protein KDK07_14120 [Bauldia sp.]|nr:hypothetical protein [Bauldia sp.]
MLEHYEKKGKKKKPVKIKFKTETDNTDNITVTIELGKLKLKNSSTLVVKDGSLSLEFSGDFKKSGGAFDGTVTGFKLFDGNVQLVAASHYNFSVSKLRKAQKALEDGDNGPINKLLFGKAMDIKGSNGDDSLTGGPKGDKIDGKGGTNTIFGLDGNDVLIGGDANDFLYGGFDDDFLDGRGGQNVLHGDLGADYFAFSSINGFSQVLDYGPGDYVGVAKSAFAGIGPTGPINPGLIEYNVAAATQSDTRFFFTPFGAFFYDSNGSGGGGQVQIGQFQGIVPSTDAILIY